MAAPPTMNDLDTLTAVYRMVSLTSSFTDEQRQAIHNLKDLIQRVRMQGTTTLGQGAFIECRALANEPDASRPRMAVRLSHWPAEQQEILEWDSFVVWEKFTKRMGFPMQIKV